MVGIIFVISVVQQEFMRHMKSVTVTHELLISELFIWNN